MSHPCPRCEKPFKTPATLARHTNVKKQCAPVAALRDEAKAAAAADPLARHVWEARNLMRRAGVTGVEALDCIVAIFALREVERLYPRLADKDTWVLPEFTDEGVADGVDKGLVLFSHIAATPYDDGENRDHWHIRIRDALAALKYHPDTVGSCAPLYEDSAKMFPLADSAVSHALVRHIRDKIPFDSAADSAGRVFMTVVRDFLDGKELGQFFTPPPVVDYLAACAADGRPLGRAFDPTCGSGGFLAAAARAGAAEVHGCEIDIRVRLLGYFNALVSGAAAPRVHRADFTRGPVPDAPFDTVLANPPFGVKGVKYPELVDESPAGPNGAEGLAAFPLKSSATGLFLQRIVRCLAIGGRGCVVLPLGKELAGKSSAEVLLRRTLLTAVALREIVVIPAGAFENTGIRTVALVFDKRRELGDCLERKRRGKGYATELRPGLAPATSDVRLVQLRTAGDGKTVLAGSEPIPGVQASISVEQLEETDWSLSPDDYKLAAPAGAPGAAPLSDYPMASLGDLCEFKAGKYKSGDKTETGAYPFYTATIANPTGRSDLEPFSYPEYILFAKQGGNSKDLSTEVGLAKAWLLQTPACASCHMLALHTFADTVGADYLAHWLNLNARLVRETCARFCTGLGSINLERISALEIPLPPLEVQRAIAAELDAQAADVSALEKAAAAAERAKRIALDNALYRRGYLRVQIGDFRLADGVELVRLGDLCEFKAPGNLRKAEFEVGGIPVIGGGVSPIGSHAKANTPASVTLISGCGAAAGYVSRYDVPVFRTTHCYEVVPLGSVESRYLHHALKVRQNELQTFRFGAAQPYLHKEQFFALEIPLPPLEVQRAIAAELDALDATAKGLAAAADRARAAMKKTLELALAGGGGPAASFGPRETPGQNDGAQPADAEDLFAELANDDGLVAARGEESS